VAKRKVTVLVDDIDGSRADGTVVFGIDGAAYEVDLAESNEQILREAIAKFCGAATRVGKWQVVPDRRQAGPARAGRPAGSAERSRAIREWAAEAGIPVSPRGRIGTAVIARYEQAQQA
jgi:hypothetical protein